MKGNIIFTFDDVLVYTTMHLYNFLESDYTRYSKVLDLYTLRNKKDIYNRDTQNLITFLLDEKSIKKTDPGMGSIILMDLMYTIFRDYYNKPKYLNDAEISSLASKVLLNPLFTETGGINNVYILFKYRTEENKNTIQNFIKNNFKHNKIKSIPVKLDENYSDIINNKIKNWDLFVSDSIDDVERLASGDIDHKEFLLPKYGYNEAKPELLELIKQKYASISYYDYNK